MAEITTLHYLVVAAALLIIGTIGVLTRRNVVIILMSIELILNAVNLNLVAFSRLYGLHGQIFSIFVITDAAAEAAVGLGIIIAFLRDPGPGNVFAVGRAARPDIFDFCDHRCRGGSCSRTGHHHRLLP